MHAAASPSGLNRSEVLQFAGIAAFAAVAVVVGILDVSPIVVFIVAGLAVAGMAHVLSLATEQAGESAGPRVSALLNATFGNAAEIIIVVLAIRKGGELIDVARFSIIGSILGNVVLILGASLLGCGLRHGRKGFNQAVASVNGAMLLLATAALAIPTLFVELSETTAIDEQGVSHGVAIVMAVLYVAYIIHSFSGAPEETGHAHGSPRWSVRLAVVVLVVSAIATGVLSEVLVGAIGPTIEDTGVSAVFVGLIVVPLLGNVAEHFAAVKIAWHGDLDFSMGIAFNSALQVALAVSAIAVGAGVVFGHEVTLGFGAIEIAVLVAAALMAAVISSTGTATWLEGLELLSIYAIAALVFWYL